MCGWARKRAIETRAGEEIGEAHLRRFAQITVQITLKIFSGQRVCEEGMEGRNESPCV